MKTSHLRPRHVLPFCFALAACNSSSKTAEPSAPASGAAPSQAPTPTEQPPAAVQQQGTPAAAQGTPPAMPMPSLMATPADKLGTAPAGVGIAVGTKAPDATLVDVSGKPQKLSALYSEKPTFVVFYRGGWCPFCNLQLHALATAKAEFDSKGLNLVAISVDQPGEEAKTQAKHGVPFPMLSDSMLVAHKAFNVVHVPAEAEAKAMAGFGVDLEKFSGQKHHSFAVPAIFLVDQSGVVRWEHVDNDYKTRPTPAQMLEVAGRVLAKK
jgi:peroxiredoxin